MNNAVLNDIAGAGRGIKAAVVIDHLENAVRLIEGADTTLPKFKTLAKFADHKGLAFS